MGGVLRRRLGLKVHSDTVALVLDIVPVNDFTHAAIHQQHAVLTLPGYFRPTKVWGLLVIQKGELIAAIELKASRPILRKQL